MSILIYKEWCDVPDDSPFCNGCAQVDGEATFGLFFCGFFHVYLDAQIELSQHNRKTSLSPVKCVKCFDEVTRKVKELEGVE